MLQFFKKLKLYTKLVPATVIEYSFQNLFVSAFILPSSTKAFFDNWNITLNYWFISKIDNFICKCSSQLDICLTYCFFSFLGDNNIWWQFLHFVITLIEEDFATQMGFFVFKPSLNWDTVSHIVWKLDNQYHKTIVLNNMTIIQYWVY